MCIEYGGYGQLSCRLSIASRARSRPTIRNGLTDPFKTIVLF